MPFLTKMHYEIRMNTKSRLMKHSIAWWRDHLCLCQRIHDYAVIVSQQETRKAEFVQNSRVKSLRLQKMPAQEPNNLIGEQKLSFSLHGPIQPQVRRRLRA